MANVLFFTRNRCTSVEQVEEKTVRSTCQLQDTLMDILVEVTVKIPDLEIMGIRGEVRRSEEKVHPAAFDLLQKAVGVRIGPGMVKIVKGLVGEKQDLDQLVVMIDECCQAVILSFTKNELAKAPRKDKEAREFYRGLVRENPRLYNSCIAFVPESPLVKKSEPGVTTEG
jgi:hypothetical protein